MTRGMAVGPGMAAVLHEIGVDPVAALGRAGLPGDLFTRDGSVPVARYFDLWDAVEAEFGRPDLAVHVARALTVEALDPPLVAGLCSANLATAARRIAVYKRLIGPMELLVDETPDRLRLEVRWVGTTAPPDALVEAELLFWVVFARTGTRHTVHPRALHLPRPREDSSALADFTGGARLHGSSATAIEFSTADARRPFLTRNNAMWDLVEPGLRRSLDQLEADAAWSERVSAVLVTALAAGVDAISHVAAELAVSPRSLQRHLAREGTTYARVLSATREQLAVHYLRDTSLSNIEIALLLGYDEPTSFHRAFHGWTGRTPGDVRGLPGPVRT